MGKEASAMVIALIPARGGSKGIPNKNLIDVCGKPLIAWSIIQAQRTSKIDAIFVSSDSSEILEVACRYGAQPIRRPVDISGDFATSEAAVVHCLEEIKESVELIIMLQPTSPLRMPDDLNDAIQQFRKEQLDSMFSGAMLEDFLIWNKSLEGDYTSFNYDFLNRGRRQDRTPQYVENGSFYIFKPEVIHQGNRLGGRIGIYLMDSWQTFEIDSLGDLEIIKIIFDAKLKSLYEKERNVQTGSFSYV